MVSFLQLTQGQGERGAAQSFPPPALTALQRAEVKGLGGVRGPCHSCCSSLGLAGCQAPLQGAKIPSRVLSSQDSPLHTRGCNPAGLLQSLPEGAAASTERVFLPQLHQRSETFQNSYSGLIIPFWKWIKLKRKKALLFWNMSIRTGASAQTVVLEELFW